MNTLWAANPDGSGLKKLIENTLSGGAIQPGSHRLAAITADSDRMHHLALNLVSLPDGKVEKITNLTSPQTEKWAGGEPNPGDSKFEALQAVALAGFAWSPDGKKLAFIGLLDGPSADLYLYDTANSKVKRVTFDSAQDFQPVWSPDGKNIIVFGAETFGTGAGYMMSGVWSARADGSNVKSLYNPKNNSGESLIGWRNPTTAILTSWGMACGDNQLRLFNLENAQITSIHKDCIKAAASPNGTMLYGDDQGLYLLDSASSESVQVAKGETTYVHWNAASSIFVAGFNDGRLFAFNAQGKNQQQAPEDGVLNAAGRKGVWAWSTYNEPDSGVWISGPGMETGQIFTKKAGIPLFDAQKNLLFFADTHLYRSTSPRYETAEPVAELNDSVQEAIWMEDK
jgi:WD40 repeat protein